MPAEARWRGAPLASPFGVVFPEEADEVLVPMSRMRKGIAAQMTRALAAPHAYVQMEIDVSRLVELSGLARIFGDVFRPPEPEGRRPVGPAARAAG